MNTQDLFTATVAHYLAPIRAYLDDATITEVMINPIIESPAGAEWFEIKNTSASVMMMRNIGERGCPGAGCKQDHSLRHLNPTRSNML